MLSRFWYPENSTESKPFNFLKSFFVGSVASSVYSRTHFLFLQDFGSVNAVENFERIMAERKFSLNRTIGSLLSGGARFAFYDFFKKFFSAGFGERWNEKLRWITYALSATAAESLAVAIALPFKNVKILSERILSLEQIKQLRDATNQAQIRELFPEEAIETEKNYFKGYQQALVKNVPRTLITFTTFELASEIWYDYIVRTPKEQFNGLSQTLFSLINGSIAGTVFYFATKALTNLQSPAAHNASPRSALIFYSTTFGVQFTVYNLLKIVLNGETLGTGTNSQKY